MAKFKRCMSLLLVVAMLAGCLMGGTIAYADEEAAEAAPEETVVPIDVGEEYQQAMELLSMLGIMSAQGFEADKTMTRYEYVEVIIKALKYDDVVANQTDASLFADVTDQNKINILNLAAKLGLVNGDGSGNFNPDDPITYIQALKIAICALGYQVEVDYTGGYSVGYAAKSVSLGFDSVIDQFGDQPLTMGDAVKIVAHMLECDIMKAVGVGDRYTYQTTEGWTFLYEYYNIYTVKGIVKGTEYSNLDSSAAPAATAGQIVIDSTKYEVKDIYTKDYLGYKVKAYVDTGSLRQDNTVVLMFKEKMGSEVTVEFGDFITVSDTDIEYYDENGHKQKLELEAYANILYNGMFVGQTYGNAAQFKGNELVVDGLSKPIPLADGQVRFVDPDGNGYSLMVIDNYTTYVAGTVTANSMSFRDLLTNTTVSLEADSKRDKITIIKEGEVVDFSAINKNSVVTIAYSISADERLASANLQDMSVRVITAYVSDKTAEITVDSVGKESKTVVNADLSTQKKTVISKIYTADSTYEAANIFYNVQIADDEDMGARVEPGDEGTAYLDVFGKIAMFEINDTSSAKLGYMFAMGKGDGIDPTIDMKIFTTNGKFIQAKAAKKVDYNPNHGVTTNTYSASAFYNEYMKEANIRQLIMYSTNEAGEITEIQTVVPRTNMKVKAPAPLTDSDITDATNTRILFNTIVAEKYRMTAQTKIFNIPTGDAADDQSLYSVGRSFDTNDTYGINVFNVDENYEIGAMIYYTTSSSSYNISVKTARYPIMVESVSQVMGDDGIARYCLNGYQDGSKVKFNFSRDGAVYQSNGQSGNLTNLSGETVSLMQLYANASLKPETSLKKGDLVFARMNGDNEIVNVFLLHSPNLVNWDNYVIPWEVTNGGNPSVGGNRLYIDMYRAYTKVVDIKKDSTLVIQTDGGANTVIVNMLDIPLIYIYDSETDRITTGKVADIEIGDTIFYLHQESKAQLIVIYK